MRITTNGYSDFPKRKVRCIDDGSEFIIKGKNNKITIKSSVGYTTQDKLLAVLRDTGNEFIIDFNSWSSNYNDSTFKIDYSEAHMIYHVLKYIIDNDNDIFCGKQEIKDKPRKNINC